MSPHVLTFTKTIILRISLEILTPSHSQINQIHTIPLNRLLIIKLTYITGNHHISPLSIASFNLKQRRQSNSAVNLAQARGSRLS